MPNLIQKLRDKNLITPPKWLPENIHYLCIMGSFAYGVNNDTSDMDVYGFCIPPREIIFPHTAGKIYGFGPKPNEFWQYQQHHIQDTKKQYDLAIYNIVKYFQLCMDNNPNMIDSLFVPHHAVLSCTSIGRIVRDNRHIFLHKGAWHKFRGYAYSQLAKIQNKENRIGKRVELINKFGYDVKFAYHLVRLMLEVEQILTTQDLDLQRDAKLLKAIRNGEWSEEKIINFFSEKEAFLEKVYEESTLPYSPRINEITELLISCLELHYGNITLEELIIPYTENQAIEEIKQVLEKYKLL